MVRRFVLGLSAILFLGTAVPARADDDGYFLSWQQKKELLSMGRIQDSAGTWYDIWICPGYAPPSRYAWEHLKIAGADFHEYVEVHKYHSLKEGSTDCFRWAFKQCGLAFTVKGIPRAWNRHFSVAHRRTQQRVFGWWMAYPWAFMESTVETAFRGVLGAVGTAGGTVCGVAVVPSYHALNSAVAGVWNLGVNTIILPVVGVTWNTVVGPPMALIGQKPAPSRVDGFWVTVVNPGSAPIERKLTPEEVQLLGTWGVLLLKETQPLDEKRTQIDKDAQAKTAALYKEINQLRVDADRQRNELQKEEHDRVRQALATNEISSALLSRDAAFVYTRENDSEIRSYLAGQNLSGQDIGKIMSLLREYSSPRAVAPPSYGQKTDPLRRGVEVIGESAEDALR
ncbi:MAG: hypothetical protein V1929_12830 [bacterium]